MLYFWPFEKNGDRGGESGPWMILSRMIMMMMMMMMMMLMMMMTVMMTSFIVITITTAIKWSSLPLRFLRPRFELFPHIRDLKCLSTRPLHKQGTRNLGPYL